MNDSDNSNKTSSDFERRAQSVIQIIIAAIVLWIGNSLVDMGKSVVSLQVQSTLMAANISEVRADGALLKAQVANAALAANTAATAATTAAALAATAATTAAALAAETTRKK